MAGSLALSDEKWKPQFNLKYKNDFFLYCYLCFRYYINLAFLICFFFFQFLVGLGTKLILASSRTLALVADSSKEDISVTLFPLKMLAVDSVSCGSRTFMCEAMLDIWHHFVLEGGDFRKWRKLFCKLYIWRRFSELLLKLLQSAFFLIILCDSIDKNHLFEIHSSFETNMPFRILSKHRYFYEQIWYL